MIQNYQLANLNAELERLREENSDLRQALAQYRAALDVALEALERWVIARESVLDVGLGDDVRTGGKPELGYALIPALGTFGSEEEASNAIKALGLPIGWVRMPLSRLVLGIDAAITKIKEARG